MIDIDLNVNSISICRHSPKKAFSATADNSKNVHMEFAHERINTAIFDFQKRAADDPTRNFFFNFVFTMNRESTECFFL